MTVEFWIGQDFETTHERVALGRFLRDMQTKFGNSKDYYFALANCLIGGNQVDLTVLKRDAVIVIEMKECADALRATENGDWLTIPAGRVIGTAGENPFEQASRYRKRWMNYLTDHATLFLSPAKARSLNFTHVSAIVCISPALDPATKNELPRLVWFRLTGLDQLAQTIYQQTSSELNFSEAELRKLIQVLNLRPGDMTLGGVLEPPEPFTFKPGSAPPRPPLMIGRETALQELKARLGVPGGHDNGKKKRNAVQVMTAVRGWPGVGKTTLAAALAHDPDIIKTFSDGVLWASLGDKPDLFSSLATWGTALGIDDLVHSKTLEEMSARLTARLRDKKVLLIVDDVWEAEHAVPFRIGGRECAMLITTRFSPVAEALAAQPGDVYKLNVLEDAAALELLRTLAPHVVAEHPQECRELVRDLEGLPLALQVAGRLLNTEAGYGWGVTDLLTELREGTSLLKAQAPADRMDLDSQTIPTVAVLLKKSTDCLDPETRDYFAFLGVFAPKPATFDLEAIAAVWEIADPRPIVRKLVDRGLLEFVPGMGRYQIHALLVMHAKSLFTE
jgi:hypothetical protein